jgi:hypothetical protein
MFKEEHPLAKANTSTTPCSLKAGLRPFVAHTWLLAQSGSVLKKPYTAKTEI